MPIIEFITADIRTEILDNNEPAQAAAALADADVVLTGAWRSGFPAAPKYAGAFDQDRLRTFAVSATGFSRL
jgi:hypothetical protein